MFFWGHSSVYSRFLITFLGRKKERKKDSYERLHCLLPPGFVTVCNNNVNIFFAGSWLSYIALYFDFQFNHFSYVVTSLTALNR